MESYLMMLYVTLEQETALKTFFITQGWAFQKPDLTVTTDKLGPVIKPSAGVLSSSQSETIIAPEPDLVPKNSPGSSGKPKPRTWGKRNYNSNFAQGPLPKIPRLQEQPACSSSNFNPTQESESVTECSDNVVIFSSEDQTEEVTFQPVSFDNGNSAIVKQEYVDTEYEQGNDAGIGNESTVGPDETHDYISGGSADQDVFMCLNTSEGNVGQNEQKDVTAEQSKQPKRKRPTYRSYSPSAMVAAYEKVITENCPVRRVAREFGVPEASLRDRVKGRIDPQVSRSGAGPFFTREEEEMLASQLLSRIGESYTRAEIIKMATDYAVSLGYKKDQDHPLSLQWFRNFKTRWPELQLIQLTPSKKSNDSENRGSDR